MTSILMICTGNVCRSPIAEGSLRSELAKRFGEQAPAVSSAGTAGWEGSPATPEAVQAADERDLDISGHIARRLTPRMIEEADLLLAMAVQHREAIDRIDPSATARTYTLKELVRLAEHMPEALEAADPSSLGPRIDQADALRASGFRGNPMDEEIPDPLGMPLETFRAIAWEIDDWCRRLVTGLFGKAPARSEIFD